MALKRRHRQQAVASGLESASKVIADLMAQRRARDTEERRFAQQNKLEDLRTANDARLAEEQSKRADARQREANAAQIRAAELASQGATLRDMTPEIAHRASQAGQTKLGGVELAPFLPTQQEAGRSTLESMTQKPEMTPTQVGSQFRMTPGGVSDPMFQGPFPRVKVPGAAGKPDLDLGEQVAFPMRKPTETRPPIEDLLQAKMSQDAQKRETALASIAAAERAKGRMGPGGSEGFMGQGGFVETKPDVATQARTAGRIAGSEASARVGPAVETAKQIKALEGGAGIGTDQDQMLGSMIPDLIQSHMAAKRLEDVGARMKPGVADTLQSPTRMAVMQSIPGIGYSDDSLAYADAAKNFTNSRAWQLSGVTVREDEFPRFLAAYFASGSDPEPLVKQKQTRRESLISTMTIATGKGKVEAGRALGREIAAGRISPEILGQLSFPPDFVKGIMETYKVPVVR